MASGIGDNKFYNPKKEKLCYSWMQVNMSIQRPHNTVSDIAQRLVCYHRIVLEQEHADADGIYHLCMLLEYNIYWSTSERPPAGLPGEKYTNPIRCEEIGKSLSRITLRELAKIGGDSQIRHIWIDDHPYDENHHNSTSMPKDFPHAIKQSLKTLIIRGVGRLKELRNLM